MRRLVAQDQQDLLGLCIGLEPMLVLAHNECSPNSPTNTQVQASVTKKCIAPPCFPPKQCVWRVFAV